MRVRGVAHPLPARPVKGRQGRRDAAQADGADWAGPPAVTTYSKGALASAIVLGVVILLAAVLSSPDDPPVTVQSWAHVAPADFLGTAISEIDGTSETASYGPPYNNADGSLQRIGVSWELLAGVRQPINAAQTFVLSPLSKLAVTDPALARALGTYEAAPASVSRPGPTPMPTP